MLKKTSKPKFITRCQIKDQYCCNALECCRKPQTLFERFTTPRYRPEYETNIYNQKEISAENRESKQDKKGYERIIPGIL